MLESRAGVLMASAYARGSANNFRRHQNVNSF